MQAGCPGGNFPQEHVYAQELILLFPLASKAGLPAERTYPVAVWDGAKRWRKAEHMASAVALVTKNYLVFVMPPSTELAVEGENIGRNSRRPRRRLCFDHGLQHSSSQARTARTTRWQAYETLRTLLPRFISQATMLHHARLSSALECSARQQQPHC